MALTQEQIRALDGLRQRLSALASSLQAARLDLERNEPVPKWDDLQSSAQLIALNIDQANQVLNANRQLFTEAHAYPLPTFPGAREEGLLETLLRKRLDPKVEDWIGVHTKPETTASWQVNGAVPDGDTGGEQKGGLSAEDMKELWNWAGPASNDIVRALWADGQFDEDFTLEEQENGVENVVTGLKRDLVGKEEDGDEEADDDNLEDADMEDVAPERLKDNQIHDVDVDRPPMPLETILRFMSTGSLPGEPPPGGEQAYRR